MIAAGEVNGYNIKIATNCDKSEGTAYNAALSWINARKGQIYVKGINYMFDSLNLISCMHIIMIYHDYVMIFF